MPGAYAHLTLANKVSETQNLERLDLPEPAIRAVLRHSKFCEMGAISPDYPYLHLHGGRKSSVWSDLMHHKHEKAGITPQGNVLHVAIEQIRGMEDERQQQKCLAWLLGYAAHVGADVTVHPVVNLKVGNYDEGNQEAHRICEMHQDAYIYKEVYGLDVGISEHIDGIIGGCTDEADKRAVDSDITELWAMMLAEVYPLEYMSNEPKINAWHDAVLFYLDDIAEEGYRLFPFARHVAIDKGLTYPDFDDADPTYLENLDTPLGNRMSYDDIFSRAVSNIGNVWKSISDAVFRESDGYLSYLGIWDLDSGLNEDEEMILWS